MGKHTYRYKPKKDLLHFATPTEAKLVEQLIALDGDLAKAARKLDLHYEAARGRLRRLRSRAARKGYVPEHGMTKPLPDNMRLRGATIQQAGDGSIERVWIKGWEEHDSRLTAMCDAIERVAAKVKGKARKTMAPKAASKGDAKDLLRLYGIGDPHFGLYAWHREAGGNWDLKIAKKTHMRALQNLVGTGDPCDTGVLLSAGDQAHADDSKGRTPTNGNILDTDSRWSHVLDILVESYIGMVEMMLKRHRKVHVYLLPGNHDPQTTLAIQMLLKMWFLNEPRVFVSQERHLYDHMVWGQCLFGFHHGHGAALKDLPIIMASKWRKDWGDTLWRRIYTGHRHREETLSVADTSIDILPTLAVTDTWADGMGYIAQRSMLADTWHRTDGMLSRNWTFIRHVDQSKGEDT